MERIKKEDGWFRHVVGRLLTAAAAESTEGPNDRRFCNAFNGCLSASLSKLVNGYRPEASEYSRRASSLGSSRIHRLAGEREREKERGVNVDQVR